MRTALALVCGLVLVSGCGGDKSPAPSPSPINTTFSYAFTGETTTPSLNTYWLERETAFALSSDPTAIGVRVNANFTAPFSKVRGTLRYDGAVLESLGWTSSDFMKQGGALVDFFISSPLTGTGRELRIDRPDSLPGVTGSGTILILWFKAANQAARGKTSPLQWDDAHAYTASFSERLSRTYGGSITVQ